MRILLTAIGSYGDVIPMAWLARGLVARGHQVTLAASPYFSDIVAASGAEHLPLGTVDQYQALTQAPDLWHPRRGMSVLFRDGILRRLPETFAALEMFVNRGCDVAVSHMLDFGSRLLRETRGVRLVNVVFAPGSLWSEHRSPVLPGAWTGPGVPRWLNRTQFEWGNRLLIGPLIGKPLNEFRATLGLPAVSKLFPDWWFAGDLLLGLFPDWFGPVQPDWPQPVALAGFALSAERTREQLPTDLQLFLDSGEPPIIWAAGTANRHAASYFTAAIEVCQRLGRRGVLLTKYPEQLPSGMPATIHHAAFVPLSPLLARAAAFVHHGGIGSSAQALAAGTPQLVVPLAFDQFDNAYRVKELGVGATLPRNRFSVRKATAALRDGVLNPNTQQAAAQIALRMQSSDALTLACEHVERVAASS